MVTIIWLRPLNFTLPKLVNFLCARASQPCQPPHPHQWSLINLACVPWPILLLTWSPVNKLTIWRGNYIGQGRRPSQCLNLGCKRGTFPYFPHSSIIFSHFPLIFYLNLVLLVGGSPTPGRTWLRENGYLHLGHSPTLQEMACIGPRTQIKIDPQS